VKKARPQTMINVGRIAEICFRNITTGMLNLWPDRETVRVGFTLAALDGRRDEPM